MKKSIIINIPKREDKVKNSALTSRAKQQNISVVKNTLSVNNVLKKNPSLGSLSEKLTNVVNREFAKIKVII